ncbi:suppressor of fused domain protein [Brevibacillus laterosporus]|uniref:Suppressor of fused protein (SUFU) n=2 Tax=Brevibacillus TaxID=55080 RepID=A0A0F7EGI6_BRELA|nr:MULTISPECIES: suppressor of fused domain protein [Brevibacillus]AKF93240.1 Suppressor of fused protein (SUFU) [Brevibacillus laterosporus]MCR8987975.1 suppressor of fused domain protein [Brevibacillus laterosporus]MCZ0833714.1 suppressor of fused domain protein [Brevibacillus halotolerans]
MNFLKKIFGGKNNGEKSKDGTTIYKYEESASYSPPAPMEYVEEIVEHFEAVFPGRESSVFHEIISDTIHIDVNILKPTEEEPFWVLYTTGMSDLPMTIPDEVQEQLDDQFDRAEVMMFLPASWELTQESMQDENNYWPIRLMKQMARFPHQYNTWLGYGHTIPNYQDYEPYADSTGLNGVVIFQLKEEISVIPTKDGNKVNAYFLLPLYKEEMEYKLEHGMDALMEKLSELGDEVLVLQPNRRNTCR